MGFWKLTQSDEAPAAIEPHGEREWSYAALRRDVACAELALPQLGRKSLGLILAQNNYECLVAYLAALNSGCALVFLDATLNPALLQEFLVAYAPDWIFTTRAGAAFDGYSRSGEAEWGLFVAVKPRDIQIHPDLALLLNTSGSTGHSKLVRLSYRNLEANAQSIAEYLRLGAHDRPITSLPLAYSYGLSVINSHLYAGASIVFTDHTVLRREFWDAADRYQCTSFSGVPYTYEVLLQTGLLGKRGSSLRLLTQAGGRLEDRHIKRMHDLALARGWEFVVMYGQTEAAPRISYVPFEHLGRKVGSIGIAVPGGSLSVDPVTGELVYSGPNVMMGYAAGPDDLARGDELGGVLRTGDLGRRDEDGYFYITGRLTRFLKLFGRRFNLDELEQVLSRRFDSVVACCGTDESLLVAIEKSAMPENAHSVVCELFELPRASVKVIMLEQLPRTANGKLDRAGLAARPAAVAAC